MASVKETFMAALVVLAAATGNTAPAVTGETAETRRAHGIAMHGEPKYPPGFKHFDYVNPAAPKGGEVRLSALGGFDSFNGFIIKGRPAAGLGLIYDTLMVSAADEPFSQYGLLAETIETPPDRSWVAFTLRREARWHDGRPVTVEDVIWTFNTLRTKGDPFYRFYYANVAKVEKTGPRTVRFDFKPGENRELPLILGQLPVLPRHYWEKREFAKTTLEPPLGSGPYRIKSFEANRTVVYERVPDYWGRALPVKVGFDNFDIVRYEYFRDATVALEAFKAGAYDFRLENSSKAWATAYDFPAVRKGWIKKEAFKHGRSAGMQGFAFNLRRPIFRDRRVRRALAYAFDFEWSNKTLFYGQYRRTRSFFENSELAAKGLPRGEEKEILERLSRKYQLPPEVLKEEYNPPRTAGDGNIRANLRIAVKLLRAAGWRVDRKTRKLTHAKTGRVMRFEIMLVSPLFERIVLPFVQNLKRLGIDVRVRVVDSAQYQRRILDFDYDMIVANWGQSLSPGNEQRNFWGSAAADRPGSRNLTGIKDPAVDELIELVIAAPTRESLVARVRALDRVLQWQHIVIPHWHIPYDRVVYWNKFGRPEATPIQGVQLFAWWVDRAKAEALQRARKRSTAN